MRIISGTKVFHIENPTAAAIGKFDGVHLGHRELLQSILEAKSRGLLAAAFTFDSAPAAFFSGKSVKELTTKEEKRRLFRQLGVDILIEFPLTKETAAMEPEQFVRQILVKQMNTAFIAAGTDLSFGNKGAGNCELLRELAKEGGYEVKIIDKVMLLGEEISSTRVRKAVEEGRMEEAKALLGSSYSIMGNVVHGRALGRKLGMPTVNLLPPKDKLLPPSGVYFSQVECCSGLYRGITNVGRKPTVEEAGQMGVETYIYDFSEDIYDTFITVRLEKFVRPEMKFPDVESLKAQMKKDIDSGKEFGRG